MTEVAERRAPPAVLPEESVTIDGLGSIKVRGLRLRDRLRLSLVDTDSFEGVAKTLAAGVVYDDGTAVYTTDEWEAWGSTRLTEAMDLFDRVARLSGLQVAEGVAPK